MPTGLTALRIRPQQLEQTVPPMLDWAGRSAATPPPSKPLNAFAPPPPTDYVLQWHLALEAEREPGMTLVEVIAAVDANYPGLREKMIAQQRERNAARTTLQRAGRSSTEPTPPRAFAPSAPPSQRDLVAEWNSAVDQQVANGLSRPAAVREVNRRHPGLREAMIEQHNRAR